MIRNTNTEKWKDAWFTGLSPVDKLVFIFLTENCDLAGFYEVNLNLMANLIGLSVSDLRNSLGALKRSFLSNHKDASTRKLWMKKYLLHQDCLPLHSENKDHMKIKFMLESNFEDFSCPMEMRQIIDSQVSPAPSKKGTSRKKFQAPEWDEFWEYYKERLDNEETAKSLFNHYLSVGWKVGNKPMVDWKAAVRKNIPNHQKQQGVGMSSGSKTRTTKLQDASESFLNEGIDE